jgi:hypothetical protein
MGKSIVLHVLAAVTLALLGSCGGADSPSQVDDTGTPPPPPVLPAKESRWAALEVDSDADGMADQITLFEYDTANRRSTRTAYLAADGVPVGEATGQTRWDYDAQGRVAIILSRGTGWERTSIFTYDAAGRVATQSDTLFPDGTIVQYQYRWRDGRLVERTIGSGATPSGSHVLDYGDDGFVSSIRQSGSAGSGSTTYGWRPDGQPLGQINDNVEFISAEYYSYDDAGRHIGTRFTDDGYEYVTARVRHDAQGRLTEIAYGNPVDDFADLVPSSVDRYRWETAPCQPVEIPGMPPLREGSGLLSPTNVSFGCGP